jgi:hypothetical protein
MKLSVVTPARDEEGWIEGGGPSSYRLLRFWRELMHPQVIVSIIGIADKCSSKLTVRHRDSSRMNSPTPTSKSYWEPRLWNSISSKGIEK